MFKEQRSNVSLPKLFSVISFVCVCVLCVNIPFITFCTFMFVHVTFECVRHVYAPIYTIDVALTDNNCTKQIVALDITEDIGLLV